MADKYLNFVEFMFVTLADDILLDLNSTKTA